MPWASHAYLHDQEKTRLALDDLRTELLGAVHVNQTAATKAQTELASKTAELAALRASFEWLTEHVNRLERERSELLARLMGVSLPAMSLGVREDVPTPTQTQVFGRAAEDEYGGSIPALQAVGALFEDVGDEHASQLGARHDAMGNVTWTK